jgi:AraC-like DNA-binding protein
LDWLDANIRECQALVSRVVFMRDVAEIEPLADVLVAALPDPTSAAEELLLRGLLLELAAKWGDFVHGSAHRSRTVDCGFLPQGTLSRFWCGTGRAKERLADWSRAFASDFARTHPRSLSQAAARVIHRDYRRRLDADQIARTIGITSARLRRIFLHEVGMDVTEYVRRVRLIHALEQLIGSDAKVEPIAIDVGYRSKKNFYHAFKALTGMTPAEFRQMPTETAQYVIDSARVHTYWGCL